MELFLDDKPLKLDGVEEMTVSGVIDYVSELLRPSNRVICEVMLDGRYEGDLQESGVGQKPISQIGSLRLKSEEPRRLAIRTLYDIVGYMPKVREALVNVSANLQSRQEEEALALLAQVTQTWMELNQGYLRAAQVLGVSLDDVSLPGIGDEAPRSAEALHDQVLDMLDQAADFLDERRYLELSDLLEYELAPLIPQIEEGMYLVIREAERKPH